MNDVLNDDSIKEVNKYYLKPGYIYVANEPTIITTILGSCVAVCMYDMKKKYGGMNHFLFPKKEEDLSTTKYGDISTITLINTFKEFGSKLEDLVAHVVGAGYLEFSENSKFFAQENIKICKQILSRFNIKIISENTGGIEGRKVTFFTESNKVEIANIKKISDSSIFYINRD